MDSKLIFAAGILSLFISLVHLIGGQVTLVDPMLDSNMIEQTKVEWLGAWHAISILLFAFAYILIKNGLKYKPEQKSLMNFLVLLCLFFSISFIGASIYMGKHAPQYILFLPLALLIHLGIIKQLATD